MWVANGTYSCCGYFLLHQKAAELAGGSRSLLLDYLCSMSMAGGRHLTLSSFLLMIDFNFEKKTFANMIKTLKKN